MLTYHLYPLSNPVNPRYETSRFRCKDTQPLGVQRLTDEEWQQQLEKNPRKGEPTWMKRIIVPLNKKPEMNEEFFYSSGC